VGTADRSTNCKAMYSKRLREFNVSPNAEISQLSVTKAKVKKNNNKTKKFYKRNEASGWLCR